MYPVEVGSRRLLLREFSVDDLDATLAVVGDDAVTSTLSFDSRDRATQERALAADVARARTDPRPDYYLAVVERESDELVGFARLGLSAHRGAELGYAVVKSRWGVGYATEASAALVEFGFTTLGLHRIQAAIGPDNIASRRVVEKLGFSLEGRLRHHVFTNGAWRDSLLFSVLVHEWPQRERWR